MSVYTFDAVTSINQLLFTHPNTISFSLIEEGTLHRASMEHLTSDQFKPAPDQELFVPRQEWRFFDSGVCHRKVTSLFRFSKSAFTGSSANDVRHLPTVANLAKTTNLGIVLALGFSNEEPHEKMIAAAEWLNAQCAQTLALKPHPATPAELSNHWVRFLHDEGFATDLVSDSCVLEAELLAGNISALASWGSTSLSLARELGITVHDFSAPN